jgi:hypothetical protein
MDYLDNRYVCKPAMVYFAIATILAVCSLVLLLSVTNNINPFPMFSTNMIAIIVCTLALSGLCNINPMASWWFVYLWVAFLVFIMFVSVYNELSTDRIMQ